MSGRRIIFALSAPLVGGGCAGVQSALQARGAEAAEISPLFWTATMLCAAVTLVVILILAIALWGPPAWRRRLGGVWIVYGGGIVFPAVALTLLLGYGLVVLEAGASRAAVAGEPEITVTGERWWWRVTYRDGDGGEFASANELRLPVGRKVAVRLESTNVIHSFWVPNLAGKLDMIPGRTNVIALEATQAGVSRGQCAEYCGGAHALMSFHVVALPEEEYTAWRRREAAPASDPDTKRRREGRRLFLENGCGACHAIRGTAARGTIGPDLTHVGGRMSLAAAALPNDARAIAAWITGNQHIKPGNLMPEFRQFTEAELAAVADFLAGLR